MLNTKHKNLNRVTRIGAYAIAINQHEILLTEKDIGPYQGLLDLPGGGIEFGESPEDALRREFLEEVGMTFNTFQWQANLSHVRIVSNAPNSYHFHHLGHIYAVYDLNIQPGAIPEDRFAWHPWKELNNNTLTPFAKAAVEILKNK